MEGNEKVLNDPAPFAAPLEPVAGGLKYVTRAWCKTSDYWDVYFALMRDIPTALGNEGMALMQIYWKICAVSGMLAALFISVGKTPASTSFG